MVILVRDQNLRDNMNSATAIAQTLERQERGRVFSVKRARSRVADKLKVGIGTFENIVRGRVKSVDSALRDRMQALLVRELEHEIARLANELEIARQSGLHPACEHIGEIETHLAAIRSLMSGAPSIQQAIHG